MSTYRILTQCGARFSGVPADKVDQILNIIIGEQHYRTVNEGFVYESTTTRRTRKNVLAVVEKEGGEV